MRIGIDASRVNESPRTGTEWYTYHLIQQFKKLISPEHEVVLYMDQNPAKDLLPLPDNFSCRILSWSPIFLWTQLRLSWEMIWHSPDILFVPAHTIPIVHPKNTFITLHDIGFERFTSLYSQKLIGPSKGILKSLLSWGTKLVTLGRYNSTELDYHRWTTRYALKNAKTILTISEFSKSEIINFFGKVYQEKIKVIYPSFDSPLFEQYFSPAQIKATLQKYDIKPPYIFFIGRLEEKKNINGLVEAFNILRTKFKKDILLVLIGKEGHGYDKIKAKIQEYGLEKFIVQPQPQEVTESERAMLTRAASIFVFPSFYEGFGIPPLEAMASEVPVVAANTGSIPEVCHDAALLVDPKNTEELAQTISKVLADKALQLRLIQRGKEQIKNFSWEKCAQQTLDALLEKIKS